MKEIWEEEGEAKEEKPKVKEEKPKAKPKKKRSGAYSRRKGNAYELKIIKELEALGYDELKSSRSESRSLDNDKIDIAQLSTAENELPFYVQCKATKVTPSISKIIKDCPRKDKPLIIVWNKQINKEVNMASDGEYVMMTKEYFYELVKLKDEDI